MNDKKAKVLRKEAKKLFGLETHVNYILQGRTKVSTGYRAIYQQTKRRMAKEKKVK